jgi:hypothetical protein
VSCVRLCGVDVGVQSGWKEERIKGRCGSRIGSMYKGGEDFMWDARDSSC